MAREFGRNARVSSQIQKELALILQRELDRIRLGFVTINDVETNKDLAVAKIYVTILNKEGDERKQSMKYLNDSAPFIRSELAKRMRLRIVPELRFYYDTSFENGMRVAELLSDLPDTKQD
ncbi:30S ribosome-binding factor RbfA [Methylicorpusculum oleiharenae]|uniref:30S ribosome-binding factor RbfA n=1 Tax=Methylicorpusculum oleiharenae TaxID=1338687 RepID=UPI001358BCFE|nr:30S ribosome-binding factor RbfA [Methylicorpusculum oleiharenae]MBS3952803.1 30S ribosome-binding factor RbfA [Methylomicrobium sp.]MCD2452178.1 30S ribosome-binding factor RbfA [Methylicorpusculum oleiharenae]